MRDARYLPLCLRQCSEKRLRLRARAPLWTQRDGADSMWEWEKRASKDWLGASVVQPSPLLSRSPQPRSPCWNMDAHCLLMPRKGNMETKARGTAQIQLCLCLCLWRIWSRVASNVSDKRPSANPPERLALWHHCCCAQLCCAEPPSSVAQLPKTSFRSQGVK